MGELRRGVGVILIASFLIGAMAVFVRVAAQEMAAAQVVFFRFAGALALLLLISRGRGLRPQPLNGRWLLLRGLLGAASITLYFHAIQYAGASFATLLHCTYPVHTAVLASIFLREPFTWHVPLALALNLVGATIIIAPAAGASAEVFRGGLLAATASVLAGSAVVTARRLRGSEGTMLITTSFMAVGAVFSAPALAIELPPLTRALGVALLGVVLTSVGGQLCLHQGLGHTTATAGSLAAGMAVFTTAVLEASFLGEPMAPRTLLGGVFLLSAVATVSRR